MSDNCLKCFEQRKYHMAHKFENALAIHNTLVKAQDPSRGVTQGYSIRGWDVGAEHERPSTLVLYAEHADSEWVPVMVCGPEAECFPTLFRGGKVNG